MKKKSTKNPKTIAVKTAICSRYGTFNVYLYFKTKEYMYSKLSHTNDFSVGSLSTGVCNLCYR